MLTYQLQDRIVNLLSKDAKPSFPCEVVISATLGPPEVFGVSDLPSQVFVPGRPAKVNWNANTGRTTYRSDPPLEALSALIDIGETKMVLDGNVARYTFNCSSFEELTGTLRGMQHLLAPLLSLRFPEAVYAISIGGTLAGVQFLWMQVKGETPLRPCDAESLQNAFREAIERFKVINHEGHQRLAAALHYLHVAARLAEAGNSLWEFMPEVVLNLSKMLQILFGESNDNIRNQLRELGVPDDKIEADFIPLLILRSKFDVAHPRLAQLSASQLQIIYSYLSAAIVTCQDLLNQCIEKVAKDEYAVLAPGDMQLDGNEQRDVDRLVESILNRI